MDITRKGNKITKSKLQVIEILIYCLSTKNY